jgi:hypothetical protein
MQKDIAQIGMLYEEACAMRERLFLGFGFDLFEVGDFSEYLVCRLCGARQTGKTAGPDGIIPAENEMIRIEVKHSSGRKQVMGGVERLRYEFKNTSREEVTRKRVSVLVGVAKVGNSLRFFVFPLHLLKKRGSKKAEIWSFDSMSVREEAPKAC